jgi:hypothetical protein
MVYILAAAAAKYLVHMITSHRQNIRISIIIFILRVGVVYLRARGVVLQPRGVVLQPRGVLVHESCGNGTHHSGDLCALMYKAIAIEI